MTSRRGAWRGARGDGVLPPQLPLSALRKRLGALTRPTARIALKVGVTARVADPEPNEHLPRRRLGALVVIHCPPSTRCLRLRAGRLASFTWTRHSLLVVRLVTWVAATCIPRANGAP